MEKNIYLYGVTFVNFADFHAAEFVDNITVDCSLAKDIGESSSQKKNLFCWLSNVILLREQLPSQNTSSCCNIAYCRSDSS